MNLECEVDVDVIEETTDEMDLLMSSVVAELNALTQILRLTVAFQHHIDDMRTEAVEMYYTGAAERDTQKREAAIQKLADVCEVIVSGTGGLVD